MKSLVHIHVSFSVNWKQTAGLDARSQTRPQRLESAKRLSDKQVASPHFLCTWRTRQDCTPAIFFQFWIEDLGSFCRENIRYSINICGGPAAGLLLGYFWISSSEINQENEIPAFILPMRCNKFPVHFPQGSRSPSVLPRSYRDIKVQGQHSRTERKNMELDCVIKSSGVLYCFCRFFLLYALVFYVYCRVLPDVLSLMFFHVPPLGFLK